MILLIVLVCVVSYSFIRYLVIGVFCVCVVIVDRLCNYVNLWRYLVSGFGSGLVRLSVLRLWFLFFSVSVLCSNVCLCVILLIIGLLGIVISFSGYCFFSCRVWIGVCYVSWWKCLVSWLVSDNLVLLFSWISWWFFLILFRIGLLSMGLLCLGLCWLFNCFLVLWYWLYIF